MTKKLKLRLAADIVMFHLEQRPTQSGRGFFIGTTEEMQRMVLMMSSDMMSARLFDGDHFKRITKKDTAPVVSKVLFGCLEVFARRGANYWSKLFIPRDMVEDLRSRISVDLCAADVIDCHPYYKTLFLSTLLTADVPEAHQAA
ncbi:MAG: hypothetical protein G01um101429_274 [Parcubacteria group bacterium Gr01-1014_29]|nr:MAG: hypothetical protein G01um101429_274 [Parcubacteria group bacterium Gr01-1014_29]